MKHFLIFFILANILLVLSNYRIIYMAFHHAPTHVYYFQHIEWQHDYDLYLSAITQGTNGAWLYTDAYTTEQTTPGLFYLYYVLIGKIGGVFHLWVPYIYHIARLLSAEGFLIMTYLLAKQILGKTGGLLGACIVILGTISPPSFFHAPFAYFQQTPWWIEFDAIERLNVIGHFMFGQFAMMTGFYLAVLFYQKKHLSFAWGATGMFLMGGVMYPPVIAPPLLALPAAYIITQIRPLFSRKDVIISPKQFIGFVLMGLGALMALVLTRWQERQGFPWNIWTPDNMARWNIAEVNFDHDSLYVWGILPFLALPGMLKGFIKGKLPIVFLSVWGILPFILIPLANTLSIPKIRIIQAAPYVPLGLLAAYTITEVFPFSKTKLTRGILICICLLSSLPITGYMLMKRMQVTLPGISGVPLPAYHAAQFLTTHAPIGAHMIAEYPSLQLSAFVPVINYFGHQELTQHFPDKYAQLQRLYSGAMPVREVKFLLSSHHIKYVYFGPNERQYGDVLWRYDFLKKIYDQEGVQIYEVYL